MLAEPIDNGPALTDGGPGLPTLTGFENHGGVTSVGPGAQPLARVAAGTGNGDAGRTEGAWSGRVVGTYLHGPVLARNPALADLLLGWAADVPLASLDDAEEASLRDERMASVRRAGRVGRVWPPRRRRTVGVRGR